MDVQAYRSAEAKLFEDAHAAFQEEWIDLRRVGGRARVLSAGEGDPILFLSGGPDAGATWAYAAARLPDFRCLLLDRPGTGLSEPLDEPPSVSTLPSYVADLTVDVLDALGIARALLVGCSFGGFSALRSASEHPERATGVYLTGCPAFVPGWSAPKMATAIRIPALGRLLPRLPATRQGTLMSLRLYGHQRSLTAGSIPGPLLDWVLAWQRHTDTLRNDAAMIRRVGTWLGGFDPSLDFDIPALGEIKVPCKVLVGTDDTVGGAEVGERLVSALPDAELEVWSGAGHLPWYDDPDRFAVSVRTFGASL